MNQGLDLLSTSKWLSEPQFCEIWSLSCQKMARNGCKTAIYHSLSFPNSLYCTWFMRVFWETFLRYQPCDNYSKQNEIAQSSDDNLLPLYGPPYHDSDIIHHTANANNHVQENHSPKKTKKYHSPKKTTEFIPVEYKKQHKKKPHTLHSKLKPNLGTEKNIDPAMFDFQLRGRSQTTFTRRGR